MPRNVFAAINWLTFKFLLTVASLVMGLVVIVALISSPVKHCSKGYVEVSRGFCVLGYAKGTEPAFDAHRD